MDVLYRLSYKGTNAACAANTPGCFILAASSSPFLATVQVAFLGFSKTTLLGAACVRRASKGCVASGRRDSNPRHSAWKADALPVELLPHRSPKQSVVERAADRSLYRRLLSKWWGKDSNLRRLSRQIYSLVPLTAREPHLTNCSSIHIDMNEAGGGTRTHDLLLTKQLLCQLS